MLQRRKEKRKSDTRVKYFLVGSFSTYTFREVKRDKEESPLNEQKENNSAKQSNRNNCKEGLKEKKAGKQTKTTLPVSTANFTA